MLLDKLEEFWTWWDTITAQEFRPTATFVAIVVFLLLLRPGRQAYYRFRRLLHRPKGKIFPLERKMDQGAIENRIAADLITDTFEDAMHQGVLSEKAVLRLYKRLAKYGGLRDLVPIARAKRRKLHPWAVELLKERIKVRIAAMVQEPVHNIPDLGNVVPLGSRNKNRKVRATR